MRDSKIQLSIIGDSKGLAAELNRSVGRLRSFGGQVGGVMRGITTRINAIPSKIPGLAMIGGAAGAGALLMRAAREVVNYQDSLTTLGITAQLTTENMVHLNDKIHETASKTGQSREAIVSALTSMTGDIDADAAISMIENVGITSTAFAHDIGDIANAYVLFNRVMGATKEEAADLANTMFAIDGSFNMDRLANAVELLGVNKDNFAEYNALMHSLKTNARGLDGAARAIESIGAALQDDTKFNSLQHVLGADLFDAQRNIKDFEEFMVRLEKLPRSDYIKLFGAQNATTLQLFNRDAFRGFVESGRNANRTLDAFEQRTRGAKFQLNNLNVSLRRFTDTALGDSINKLADDLSRLSVDKEFTENMKSAAEGLRGVMMALLGAVETYGKVVGWSSNAGRSISQQQELSRMQQHLSRDEFMELRRKHGLHGAISLNAVDLTLNPAHQEALNRLVEDYRQNYAHRRVNNQRIVQQNDTIERAQWAATMAGMNQGHGVIPRVVNEIYIHNDIDPQSTITHVEGKDVTARVTSNMGDQR